MQQALAMPKLGLTMTEGLVAEWRRAPGESFAAGDVLVVIETDKIASDLEAPAAGRLQAILVAQGHYAKGRLEACGWRRAAVPERRH